MDGWMDGWKNRQTDKEKTDRQTDKRSHNDKQIDAKKQKCARVWHTLGKSGENAHEDLFTSLKNLGGMIYWVVVVVVVVGERSFQPEAKASKHCNTETLRSRVLNIFWVVLVF